MPTGIYAYITAHIGTEKGALDESASVAIAVAVAGVTWRCYAPFVNILMKRFEILSSLFVGFISGAEYRCGIQFVKFIVRLIGQYLKEYNNVFWFICEALVMKYMKCFAI